MNTNMNNIDTYKNSKVYSISDIYKQYLLLIIGYTRFVIDNLKIIQNEHYNFIYIKGFETITNNFRLILLYTNNLELTLYHCQKSFSYYIDFVDLLVTKDQMFKMSSRDASLFVYKKTIFDIDPEYTATFKLSDIKHQHFYMIDILINYTLRLICTNIDCVNSDNIIVRRQQLFSYIDGNINLLELLISGKSELQYEHIISITNLYTNINIPNKHINYDKLLSVLEIMHKKILIHNIDITNLQNNISNVNIYRLFDELSPVKFCKRIFMKP